MAYSALNIADIFIQKGLDENVPVTNMKLQKMIYIANGLYMAISGGSPLIRERVEAWPYGPVIKSVYDQFKMFGSGNITKKAAHQAVLTLADGEKSAIDHTWEMCRNIDGVQLSNWSHETNSPWDLAIKSKSPIISDKATTDYFSTFLVTK
jgi:uncharacterized phage-associated protein